MKIVKKTQPKYNKNTEKSPKFAKAPKSVFLKIESNGSCKAYTKKLYFARDINLFFTFFLFKRYFVTVKAVTTPKSMEIL